MASGIPQLDDNSKSASDVNFNAPSSLMTRVALLSLLSSSVLLAGPYPPAAGQVGSNAIYKEDSRIVAWAAGYWSPIYGTGVDVKWQTPERALGKAGSDPYDILCLGNGGFVTLWFPHPICDGEGADFAVFENSVSDGFLELAFVEVSSDGVHFFRFPSASLGTVPIGPYAQTMNPTDLDGLAGKYRQGYGTPFDLASLPESPLLDKRNVRFVRIVDIIGDGMTKDSSNRPIYDPTPTVGSGGFDLDAIAVLNQNDGAFRILTAGVSGSNFTLRWESNPANCYRIETSDALDAWTPVETISGAAANNYLEKSYSMTAQPQKFWRVVREN